jgi:Ca2+-binding EF-hand superfamily protein
MKRHDMTTISAVPFSEKLGKLFEALDADGDGYLEWGDYHRLAGRYASGYGLSDDDRRIRALTVCYQMLWHELLRHAQIDGTRLGRDQFVIALRCAMVDTSRFNLMEGVPHAVFDVIDADGAHTIGREDYARLLKVLDLTAPGAMDRFMLLDADGDGRVSRQEFIRSVREFLLSGDPDAPGGVVFGVI